MANSVVVRFLGETDDLQSAVDRSKTAVATVGDSIESLSGSFKKGGEESDSFVGKVVSGVEKITLGVAVAAAAISAYLIGVGTQATAFGETIRTAAGAYDQSLSSIAGTKALADRAGLGLTDLGKSFLDLQKKAKEGDDDVVAALKAIGVSTRDAATMSQDALAVRMAEAFSTAKDSANKAAAGVALFGETTAAKLVPELDRGADRIRELQETANRAGIVIGPELSANLRGTAGLMQQFSDRMLEVKEAIQGSVLQAFVQFKPAIDGLVKLFSDVVGNVAAVIEWFFNLSGAGQRASEAIGMLGQAAQGFSRGMIEASAYVQELAIRAVQSLAQIGVSFEGLAGVARGFGADIASMATIAANALFNAFREAIRGIVTGFGDLVTAAKAAMSFDTSGVSAAFAKFGSDADAVGGKIKAALSPVALTNTKQAFADMQAGAAAAAKAYDPLIAKLEAQKQAQLALLTSGGAKGAPVPQTRTVGDPKAPDDDSGSRTSGIQAAIKEAEGEVQALRDAEAQREMLLQAGVSLHQMSESEKVAATKASLTDQLQATTAIYQKLADLDGLTPVQRQEVLNKMEAAVSRYNQDILRLQIQAAQEMQKTWDAATSEVSGAINSQVDGIIQGTTRLRDAFRNVLQQMLGDAIKFCISWSLRHAATVAQNMLGINAGVTAQIAGEAAKTGAVQAGETAKTGAVEAGIATRISAEIGAAAASAAATVANVLKSIAAFAAQAFAGVTAFLSSFLGPAALGVAGGVQAAVLAVGSAIPAFASGAWALPADTIAQVHKGEMIVPAAQAELLRDLVPGGNVANVGAALTAAARGGRTQIAEAMAPIAAFDGGAFTALPSAEMIVPATDVRARQDGWRPMSESTEWLGSSVRATRELLAAPIRAARAALSVALPLPTEVAPPASFAAATVAAREALGQQASPPRLYPLDIGSWQLPRDAVAQVHAGEMIVPAAQTPWAQSLMAAAAAGGGQGGRRRAGDVHLHLTAMDTQSGVGFVRQNKREIAKAVMDALRFPQR